MRIFNKVISILLIIFTVIPNVNLVNVYADNRQSKWNVSGDAYIDDNGYLVLTKNEDWQQGIAWYDSEINTPFKISFRYKAGGGTQADGLVFMFNKNINTNGSSGGYMSFGNGGYGIEFDSYYNSEFDDPTEKPHIALIKDSVSNHIEYKEAEAVNDYNWHNVDVAVSNNAVQVKVDGIVVINYKGIIDNEHKGIGFGAGTGTKNNWHIVDIKTLNITSITEDYFDRPYIESIKVDGYDVINNVLRVDKKSNGSKKSKIDIKFNSNGKQIKEVRLQQGNKKAVSTTGRFNIALADYFDVGSDIYAIVVNQDNVFSDKVKTKLKIVDISTVHSTSLELLDYNLAKMPNGIPFLGGENFKLKLDSIPFVSVYDEMTGTTKYMLGASVTQKDITQYPKAMLLTEYNKYKKAYREKKAYNHSLFGQKQKEVLSLSNKWGFRGGASGYAEVDSRGNVISGGLVINAGGSTGIGSQSFIGVVPVYLKGEFGVDTQLNIEAKAGSDISSGKLVLNGSIGVNPYVTPQGGVGLNNMLSLGVKGKFGLDLGVNLPKNPWLKGKYAISVTGQAFIFGFDKELLVDEFDIIDSKSNYLNDINLYDTSEYKLIDRDYIKPENIWNERGISLLNNNEYDNISLNLLQQNIYPSAQPKIAKVGNKQVLIWLSDDKIRSSINRTELVYSIYDEENDIWSYPKAIDNDGTADFYPQISYDNKDIYVTWQNIKEEMNDNSNIDDFAKQSEIVVSKFNMETNTFEKPISLTNNISYDGMPSITNNNGKVFVTWLTNDENNIFGIEGNNSIMYSEYDGSKWSEADTLVKNRGSILSMDTIYNGDEKYIIYSVDEDKNPETIEDIQVYYSLITLTQISQSTKISDQKGISSYPKLINSNGKVGVFWYNNNEILFKEDIKSTNVISVLGEEHQISTDNFKIVHNKENLAILWTKNINDSIDVYATIYNNISKNWSKEIRLTNIDKHIKYIDAIFDSKGNIVIASNIAEKVEQEIEGIKYFEDGISSLAIANITPSYDIKIDSESLYVDDSKFVISQAIPVRFEVENTGQLEVNGLKVEIYDGDPNAGGTLKNSQNIDLHIKPGSNGEISVDFTPQNPKEYNLYVKVMPSNNLDVNLSNNILNFKVGNSDISVESVYMSEIENQSILNIELTNNSVIEDNNIKLRVKENNKDGNILYEEDIDYLINGKIFKTKYIIDSSSITFDENNQSMLYIEIESLSSEKNIYNNETYIQIDKAFKSDDFNKDGNIDIIDLAMLSNEYGNTIDNENWDFKYDLNSDVIIDIFDLVIMSRKMD